MDYEDYTQIPKEPVIDLTRSDSPPLPRSSPPQPGHLTTKEHVNPLAPKSDQTAAKQYGSYVCAIPGCADTEKIHSGVDPTCMLCDIQWHDVCVKDSYAEGYLSGCDEPWCCPTCIENGAWDTILCV